MTPEVSEKRIKVTDKRIFTPDGELREEYRDLERVGAPEDGSGADRAAARPERGTAAAGPAGESAPEQPKGGPGPGEPPRGGQIPTRAPGFLELIGILAEPVALYLGDARLPDGGSAENLELARLHIDLLDVLRKKTEGNLEPQESTFLDDLLYRLRLRYVQKRD